MQRILRLIPMVVICCLVSGYIAADVSHAQDGKKRHRAELRAILSGLENGHISGSDEKLLKTLKNDLKPDGDNIFHSTFRGAEREEVIVIVRDFEQGDIEKYRHSSLSNPFGTTNYALAKLMVKLSTAGESGTNIYTPEMLADLPAAKQGTAPPAPSRSVASAPSPSPGIKVVSAQAPAIQSSDPAYIRALVLGQEPVKNPGDAELKLGASTDNKYTLNPPLDGPTGNQYYSWIGKVMTKQGDMYICWDEATGQGFAFKNIEQKFGELLQGSTIQVVGQYTENAQVSVGAVSKMMPVLSNCYTF
jgi:hypothetical protein